MKTTHIIASFIVATALLSGCSKKETAPVETAAPVVETPAPTPVPEAPASEVAPDATAPAEVPAESTSSEPAKAE